MLVHPFRVMDVSISMATGARTSYQQLPPTSARLPDNAAPMPLQQIFYSSQRTAAVRILPKEFGSSTPPAIPLVLQLPCFR